MHTMLLLKNMTLLRLLMIRSVPNSPSLPKKRSALKMQPERRSLNNKRTRSTTLPEMIPRTTRWSSRILHQPLKLLRRDLRQLVRMRRRRLRSNHNLLLIRMLLSKPISLKQQVKPTLRESRKLPKMTRPKKPTEKSKKWLRKERERSQKTRQRLKTWKQRLQLKKNWRKLPKIRRS